MKKFSMVRDAVLMPLLGTMDSFTSGVFSHGQCIEDTLLHRGSPAAVQPPQVHLPGTYIFGGYLFGHYGHFILESLSRVYAIAQCRDLPMLFMSPNDKIYLIQRKMFAMLGIKNEMRLVDAPTQVDSLIVSPPGCSLSPEYIYPAQLAALGRFDFQPPAAKRKIWLSRSQFASGGIENEQDIEDALEQMGWEITHPERLDTLTQIENVSTASVVAGFDGSAFYSALFAKKIHGHFCIFGRRNSIASALSYVLAMKGVSKEEHVFPVAHLCGEFASARYHMQDINPLLRVLQRF